MQALGEEASFCAPDIADMTTISFSKVVREYRHAEQEPKDLPMRSARPQ